MDLYGTSPVAYNLPTPCLHQKSGHIMQPSFNLLNAIFSAPGAVVQMGNVVCNKFKVE